MKFRTFLNEGGNAKGTIKKSGEETLAQKIPIKDIGRSNFIKKFNELFLNLNKRYQKMFKEPLWDDISILKSGIVFNGSTSFIMNPEIHDDEVIPFKPSAGDIDIMIPEHRAKNLWILLDSLENKTVIKDVIYKGMNKLNVSAIGNQMNTVFETTMIISEDVYEDDNGIIYDKNNNIIPKKSIK